MVRLIRTLRLIATLLALSATTFAQCPLCRAVLFRSKEGQQLIGGFDNAVLFLLAFPFLLIAIFAARIALAQWAPIDCKELAQLARTFLSNNARVVRRRLSNTRSFLA